jgi:hypothetical protein
VRRLGLLVLGTALALWLAPACALRLALPPLVARTGGVLESEGVWPALPFGVRASRVHAARDGHELTLDGLRAVWTPWGARIEARVGDGTLLFRGEGLRSESGFVRVQDVELAALEPLLAAPVALRGKADGIWRFGPSASLEGSVSRGAILMQRLGALELPFAQLVLSAARASPESGWTVRWVDVQGPPLSANAAGTIGADGALALEGQVRELEEPVLSLFPLLKLPTGPLPLALAVEGSLAQPRLVARDSATQPPAGR